MKSAYRFNNVDRVIAGLWYWQFRRRLAESKIDRALENAKEVDIAYQEWTRYEFACKFGRTTEKRVADAVKRAATNGTDAKALGLLVTNGDLSECNGQLRYRMSRWLAALGLVARGICVVGSLMFSALLALAPMLWLPKLAAFVGVFGLLIAGAYIFELYTNRPFFAATRLEKRDAQSRQEARANVVFLRERPDFKTTKGVTEK